MAKKNWSINLEDGEHKIELEHGYFSGKRIIKLDNKVIEHIHYNFFDAGSKHEFKINEHYCIVLIKMIAGIKFSYDLIVDNISVQTGLPVNIKLVRNIYSKEYTVDYLPNGIGIFIASLVFSYISSLNKPFIEALLICIFVYLTINLGINILISWIRKSK